MNKFDALILDLEKAEKLASEFSGGYSGEFLSAEEFHKSLRDRLEKLKKGDLKVLEDLWVWFVPSCQWDDFVGMDGLDLGNKIFENVNSLR